MSLPGRKHTVTMPVTAVYHSTGDFGSVCCLHCDKPLGLSQPELEEPARLIGACGRCRRWYLLDWHPNLREGLMVLLPDHEDLLQVFASLGIPRPQAEDNNGEEFPNPGG